MKNTGRIITSLIIIVLIAVALIAFIPGKGLIYRIAEKEPGKSDSLPMPSPGVTPAASPSPSEQNNDNTEMPSAIPDASEKPEPSPPEEPPKRRFEDIKVRAVYLTGNSAGNDAKLHKIIELSKTTELNAVVIDIKENGKVNYVSSVPEVVKNKAFVDLYDPEHVIKMLHDNDIYVIGRLVCFRDNELATKRPDLAIKGPGGEIWKENMGSGKTGWTNPYLEEVWRYNLDIAREAIEKGFDEIQFDYVRFPTAKSSEVYYGEDVPSKADAICSFLKLASKELYEERGVPVSADVFGIIFESDRDGENIGQVLEKVGKDINYICPMVYPSHYANASNGIMGNGVGQTINGVLFTAPDLEPYKVVYNTLIKGRNRISAVEGYKADIRPYLQAFTAKYLPKGYYQTYGPQQIRQQIQAVYDAGYHEWILWDPSNNYSEEYFEKKQ